MELIIQEIAKELTTLGIFMLILGGLILVNTLIGSINAWSWGEWKNKKFWQGLLKNILLAITMAIFFIILEIIPFAFARANIIIPTEMVKGIELIALLAVAITKYVKDIYKGFMDLLGVSEEEKKSYTGEL